MAGALAGASDRLARIVGIAIVVVVWQPGGRGCLVIRTKRDVYGWVMIVKLAGHVVECV